MTNDQPGTTPNPYNNRFRYPFVTAICPTWRHPALLANSVALWQAQTYPRQRRWLVILDDEPTFHDQEGDCWEIVTSSVRLPSLPAKYNELLRLMPGETELVLVWEDDDIYLPGYVDAHVECLKTHDYSKPAWVYSDYNTQRTKPEVEPGHGRFHSSMGFTKELINRIGGWPDSKRADFDQQIIGKLETTCLNKGTPWDDQHIQYVYGWHTGAAHGQSTMQGPADEEWYDRSEQVYATVPFEGRLRPKYDDRTVAILTVLGVL